MNGKRYYPIAEFTLLGLLLLFWAGIAAGIFPSYTSSNQKVNHIKNILIIIEYCIYSIGISCLVIGKMRLGKKIIHIRYNYWAFILAFCALLFYIYLAYSRYNHLIHDTPKDGIHTCLNKIPNRVLSFLFILSCIYRAYTYEIREKGIILWSHFYRWYKIQQIDIQEKQCVIKLTNGNLETYGINLLKNNRDEILDLLREKTAVNLIDEGQESAAPSAA